MPVDLYYTNANKKAESSVDENGEETKEIPEEKPINNKETHYISKDYFYLLSLLSICLKASVIFSYFPNKMIYHKYNPQPLEPQVYFLSLRCQHRH